MVDRQEIDALLIGSLYGELSSADEARLQAHLESHPADRTALNGLARARTAVRESRILQLQLEPPQSVTALLLQEAARRAPRRPRADEGWFQRFLRSFVAHPAMAAATMLVLVLGVAGTLYLRHGEDHLSAGKASPSVEPVPAAAERQQMAPATEPPVVAAQGATATVDGETATVEGKTGYPVGLVDGDGTRHSVKQEKAEDQPPAATPTKRDPVKEIDEAPPPPKAPRAKTPRPSEPKLRNAPELKPPAKKAASQRDLQKSEAPAPRPTGPNRVLEVGTPQHAPLEIADDSAAAETTKPTADKSADRTVRRSDSAPAAGGGAAGAPAPEPQSPPPQAAPSVPADSKPMSSSRPAETAPGRVARGAGATSAPAAPNTTPAPAPPPPPPAPAPRNEPAKDKAAVTKNQGDDNNKQTAASPELAWARDVHARVISQVRAGKCPDAARLALTLSQRAPAYYEANVLHDRQLKDCVVYINSERDREAERERAQRAKAAKRNSDEAKRPPADAAGKADLKASESNSTK